MKKKVYFHDCSVDKVVVQEKLNFFFLCPWRNEWSAKNKKKSLDHRVVNVATVPLMSTMKVILGATK